MNRSLGGLAALLLTCATFAAPAPEPFMSGWGNPIDPDRDCKIRRDGAAMTIEMPNCDHDYDPLRERFNAPRILRELEGNFDLQVCIRIDCRPSAQSTVKGQPSFVSTGFLIIAPDNYSPNQYAPTYIRFEYGISREGVGKEGYAALKTLDCKKREATELWVGADGQTAMKTLLRNGDRMKEFWDPIGSAWPLPKKADRIYLRMERRDACFSFFISPDGERWTPLVMQTGPPARLKLGLAAYSTSSEPSKVRLDQLKLTRGKKKVR